MKKLLFIIAIITSLTAQSQSLGEPWEYTMDKQIHANGGFVFGTTLTTLMYQSKSDHKIWEKIIVPQIPMAFIGGVKEFADMTVLNGTASEQDWVFNQIGTLKGSLASVGAYEMSNSMLKDGTHGKNNCYTVPMFCFTGFSFLTESILFMALPNYTPNLFNFVTGSVSVITNMIIKHHIDKRDGKHEKFNKLKL